tara:strand:- start:369 stop:890 length:522 start_codon:yes stop_codon:yes gene_type:complete
MKKNNKGILIWVTGLSGSGKSFTAKKIKKKLNEKKIKSILINGDDLRKIFKLNKYDNQSRLAYAFSYSLLCKKITDQGINLIISTIAMFDVIRKWNKNNIKNYYEVYLKTPYRLIKRKNKKKLYLSKKINVIGKDIKPQLPKNPDFIIKNNFKNQDNEINLLFSKIEKIIEKK